MSHTFEASDGTVFIFNPDLSEVFTNVHPSKVSTESWGGEKITRVELSGEALLEFVGEYMRREAIDKMESISSKDIVKFMIK